MELYNTDDVNTYERISDDFGIAISVNEAIESVKLSDPWEDHETASVK